MIRVLINRKLDALERQLGAPLDYLRHMVRVSLRSSFKFAKMASVAGYRRALPADVANVAHIVAAREADCGTCVQIAVNQARTDGVSRDIIQAALDQRPDDLAPELADVYRFTEAVVRATWDESDLRERIRRRYGDEALIELALAIAMGQMFPTVKRALGYAKSCAKVQINA